MPVCIRRGLMGMLSGLRCKEGVKGFDSHRVNWCESLNVVHPLPTIFYDTQIFH